MVAMRLAYIECESWNEITSHVEVPTRDPAAISLVPEAVVGRQAKTLLHMRGHVLWRRGAFNHCNCARFVAKSAMIDIGYGPSAWLEMTS